MTEGKAVHEPAPMGTWSHRQGRKSLQGLKKGSGGFMLHRDKVPVWKKHKALERDGDGDCT